MRTYQKRVLLYTDYFCCPYSGALFAPSAATEEKHDSSWRAVDQDGNVLDILVQSRWNKKVARRFFRKLLKGLQYVPRVIITDKLKSYGAAKRELLQSVEHRQHKVYDLVTS